MQMIQLAPVGLATSALVLGCSRLGSALTPLSRRETAALIDEAYALGVRHFDTASIYGQGDSERYLGETLQSRRHRVCLSSKAGQVLTPKQALLAKLKPAVRWLAARRSGLRQKVGAQRAQGVPRRFDADHIERSLHASLRRLRTDHLDIFYLHSPPPEALQDDALMARIERMRASGMFLSLGVSCDEPSLVLKAARHELVQVVQFDIHESLDTVALMRNLATRGKLAMMRGFTVGGLEGLHERFAAAMQLPALGGLIVGTTRMQHLRENVEAFEQALQMHAASGNETVA